MLHTKQSFLHEQNHFEYNSASNKESTITAYVQETVKEMFTVIININILLLLFYCCLPYCECDMLSETYLKLKVIVIMFIIR